MTDQPKIAPRIDGDGEPRCSNDCQMFRLSKLSGLYPGGVCDAMSAPIQVGALCSPALRRQRDEARAERDAAFSNLAETAAVLEAVAAAIAGEPVDDFSESFPAVRAAVDLRAEVERLTRESAEEFARWMATGPVTDAMRPYGVFERFRDYLAKKE